MTGNERKHWNKFLKMLESYNKNLRKLNTEKMDIRDIVAIIHSVIADCNELLDEIFKPLSDLKEQFFK